MRIFHFANTTFGKHFVETLKEVRKENVSVELILVISTLAYKKREKFLPHLIKQKVQQQLGNGLSEIYNEILIIKNINHINFRKLIHADDIGIITGFNQIFTKQTILLFKTLLNVHPSLLPYYRGPVPSYWVIKNKEEYSGYTIHKIDERIDMGEVIFQEAISIRENETVNSLDSHIADHAALQLKDVLSRIIANKEISRQKLDASQFYHNLVNYKSFP